MKLKKSADFSVFSSQNPLTDISANSPKFTFVGSSTDVWFTSAAAVQGFQPLESIPAVNPQSDPLDDVAAKIDASLVFVDKDQSDIWNASLNPATSPKKSKKKPVVEDKAIEEELSKQNLYKTELCRSFAETGACRYGHKCQFAHGAHELRNVMRHPKYKTEVCKKFASTGHCPYGVRCRFIHPVNSQNQAIDDEEDDEEEEEEETPSPPMGNVVWSNSWATPTQVAAVPVKKVPTPIGPPASLAAQVDGDLSARRLAFFQSIA